MINKNYTFFLSVRKWLVESKSKILEARLKTCHRMKEAKNRLKRKCLNMFPKISIDFCKYLRKNVFCSWIIYFDFFFFPK